MNKQEMANKINEEILILILRNLERNISLKDMEKLEIWISSSDENRMLYQQLKNIYEASGGKLQPKDISVSKALEKITYVIEKSSISKTYFLNYFKKVAAILIIPLMLACFFAGWKLNDYKSDFNKNINSGYSEVFSPLGIRTAMTLPDGSKVWLNSGSNMRYSLQYEENRTVYLDGEAYFEVVSDSENPFVVNLNSIQVVATGTSFNVQKAITKPNIQVTLIEGSLSVDKINEKGEIIAIAGLEPNDHFIYDTNSDSFEKVVQDPYKYISWKDGRLIFRNDPLEEVVKRIGQIYNVDIEIQGEELKNYSYRATFEEESFDEILKLLALSSPIQYFEPERERLPDGTFAKRKVIIYPE